MRRRTLRLVAIYVCHIQFAAVVVRMSTLLFDTFLPARLPALGAMAGNRQGDRIAERVEQILTAAHPVRHGADRRLEARFAYPHPIFLTPCDRPGQAASTEPIAVIGKQLSLHGVDFYHREPLPYRRVIASLDGGEEGWIGLLLELAWCRFSRHGWYDNGGRFLSVVPSPMNCT